MLTTNTTLIKNCYPVLQELLAGKLNRYIDLFFYEKRLRATADLIVLEKAGILRSENGLYVANVMVFPFRGKFIVTDFLRSVYRQKEGRFLRGLDDVWVMFPHETLLFIDRLGDVSGNQALDIASGSGAISLFLADKFEKVISTDINPKAVSYARFNAVLNNLESRITNIESNLFQGLSDYKFDYVCWNGPTVAMPEVSRPETVYPLYTYGGFDGAQFTKKFLDQVFSYTNKDFGIKWWDGSLGNAKESSVESYIKQNLAASPIKVTIEFMNPRRGVPLREYERLYDKYCQVSFDLSQSGDPVTAETVWRQQLKANHFHYVYVALISIEPSETFEIVYKDTDKTMVAPRHVFGFEWHYVSRKFIRAYLATHNRSLRQGG